MELNVKLFAQYRDLLGAESATWSGAEGSTVKDIALGLEHQHPQLSLKGALAAINNEYAKPSDALKAGDELAFFPPVAGG